MAASDPTCPRCAAPLAARSPLADLCPRCLMELALQAGESATDDGPAAGFGPYRPIEKIGEGGMGIVWLARQDHPIRRTVALKIVKPGLDSAQVLSQFESERQALAILNHPNIATVFDAGLADDGRPYFAMEYVPGPPITAFADQRALPIAARLELFLQVCEAVEHAHQKGVLHRDLKPANILVTEHNGRPLVKVIDFGVAKALGDRLSAGTLATAAGALVGTPEYMSPEQAGLTQAVVDTRTDIYSLGLVLYELLVGALPFDAPTLRRKALLEMLRVIREDEPPHLTSRLTNQTEAEVREIAKRRLTDPRALVRQLRGDLEWITNRALEKEPARRYASASELRADVRRHLASEPVVAGPPDWKYRVGKLMRRHRGSAIGAGVAIATLVAGTIVSSMMWMRAEHARRENRDALKLLHVTTGLQLASDGNDLKALPWLVRALQLEEGGTAAEEVHRIRINHVLDGAPFPVRIWKHDGLIGGYLAPDRHTLATWDRAGTVRLWDAETGKGIGAPFAHPAPLVSLRIANGRLATSDEQGVVRVWNIDSGKESIAAFAHGPTQPIVRVAAGSNSLLSADRNGRVTVRALDSGRPKASVQLEHGVTFAEFLDQGRTIAVAGADGAVVLAESDGGKTIARLQHDDEVVDVTRLDEETVATTTGAGVLQIWNLRTNSARPERTPMVANGVDSVRVSADRRSAFMCGLSGAAHATIGRAAQPARLGTDTNCLSLDLADDGALLATAHADGTVRIWSAFGHPFATRLPHSAAVSFAAFLGESRRLVTVDGDGLIRTWEISPAARSRWPSPLFTWSSEFSPDSRQVAVASGAASPPYTGQVRVTDAATGETLLPLLRHGGHPECVAFSPDGRLIATSSSDGTARLWDAASGEPVTGELRQGADAIKNVMFSPDGRRLLTFGLARLSSSAALWEVPTGRRIATLPGTESAWAGAFSPDGTIFATVTAVSRRVRLWRSVDGEPVEGPDWSPYRAAVFLSNSQLALAGARSLERRTLDGTSTIARDAINQPEGLLLSKDGASLLVPTRSGAIHIVRTADFLPRFPALQLPGTITAWDVSADSRWMVASSLEHRARIWSMDTGVPLTPERALPLMPLSASFSRDGRRVQIGGQDATIWELVADRRPIEVLDTVAQLLSGHQLLQTQLVPLAGDRLIDLAQDPQTLQRVAPGREQNWRLMVAEYQQFLRNWTAAEAGLSLLSVEPDASWETHSTHGHVLAELGRWAEAQRAFQAARRRRPDSTELTYYDALSRAAAGDRSAIDASCASVLTQHGATRNPDRAHWLARLCVLSTTADPASRTRVRDLARIAREIEPDIGRHVVVHAAALIRAGEPGEGEQLLEELLARQRVRERDEEARLVLAVALRQRGRMRAAQESISRYAAAIGGGHVPWYRRVEADIWQRDATTRQ